MTENQKLYWVEVRCIRNESRDYTKKEDRIENHIERFCNKKYRHHYFTSFIHISWSTVVKGSLFISYYTDV